MTERIDEKPARSEEDKVKASDMLKKFFNRGRQAAHPPTEADKLKEDYDAKQEALMTACAANMTRENEQYRQKLFALQAECTHEHLSEAIESCMGYGKKTQYYTSYQQCLRCNKELNRICTCYDCQVQFPKEQLVEREDPTGNPDEISLNKRYFCADCLKKQTPKESESPSGGIGVGTRLFYFCGIFLTGFGIAAAAPNWNLRIASLVIFPLMGFLVWNISGRQRKSQPHTC